MSAGSVRPIVSFTDRDASDRAVTGGKGANLGALAQAGFPVPPGFVVTVAAFTEAIGPDALAVIGEVLAGVDLADPETVDKAAAAVRDHVRGLSMPPALADAIARAYGELGGDGTYVAVRSSGTAEDLAESSFAGQHDTYLDVEGTSAVLLAVRDCWASLWTARAVAYRAGAGFDNTGVRLAVVVQTMIPSSVSGVMFTANPLTTATDEIVVNAGWGLGEGIVSGVQTPDQFTLDKASLAVVDTVLGGKEVEVVRDPVTGHGTVAVPVDQARREALCLNERRLAELAAIGRRIEEHYGGLPQDVEWALADGQFFVLQARDVTGVEFSWDADVDDWQWLPENRDDVWSRGFADEYWTGAITPLFYSVRAYEFTRSSERSSQLWGFAELATSRRYKYWKGEAYYNVPAQEQYLRSTMPKQLRAGSQLEYLPPSRRDDVAQSPFSLKGYLRMHARVEALDPTQGVRQWIGTVERYLNDRIETGTGLSPEQLRDLSDRALMDYIDQRMVFIEGLLYDMWTGFQIHGTAVLYALRAMLDRVYGDEAALVFADLITGLPKRTTTMQENLELWELADEIRRVPELRALFDESDPDTFFDRLAAHPQGAAAAAAHRAIVARHGHRGHADRDFWFPRRAEDPGIDYRSIQALLSADGADRPDAHEERLLENRARVTAEVLARLRGLPFGAARAKVFSTMLDYAHQFLVLRDDQRHYTDRVTFSKKRAFQEVGRRLHERGRLTDPLDFYFLTKTELFEHLRGHAPERLVAAKIRGRRRNFEQFLDRSVTPPQFLSTGLEWTEPTASSAVTDGHDGVLRGLPTSRGEVTGRARVVRDLADIGRLEQGDILITNSTDPGWTPVFSIISGLVLETGGLLAHGSCLSREYRLPAVTVPRACDLIADGTRITVDGTTGRVSLG